MLGKSAQHGTIWLISIFSVTLFFVWISPFHHPFELPGEFLTIHTVLELLAVIFAAMIFTMGWYAYTPSRAMNVILIACAFLAVAILDFSHLMTFGGMPDNINQLAPANSVAFWLAARLIAAVGLLAAI